MNHPQHDARPLVVHAIHRLGIGGLENVLVNLINHMPPERYRHAIVAMTDFDPDYRTRIQREGVEVYAMHRRDGGDRGLKWRLFKLFREIRPDIVNSYNLSGLDALLPAWLAGVKVRIHSEHGWDESDVDGRNVKRQILRRIHRPLVHLYIPVSKDIARYLQERIHIPAKRVQHIYNGVDTRGYRPAQNGREALPEESTTRADDIVFGTVGRIQAVKDQGNLVRAFGLLRKQAPDLADRLKLVLIGDGPQFDEVSRVVDELGLREAVWMAGARSDVPQLLRGLDVFMLPSLSEGISIAILEAMASGLPVVASRVGGNPELVQEDQTGLFVPPAQPQALADAMERYARDPDMRARHAVAAQEFIAANFSLDAMVEGYLKAYDGMLARATGRSG